MKVEVVKLTPKLAAEWLERNQHNRSLNASRVEQFAGAMSRGEWSDNGEPYQFAGDRTNGGAMMNGQHRAAAVVASGVTVSAVVVSDLAPEAQETVDTGRPRSVGDMLALRDVPNGRSLAAAAPAAHWYDEDQTMVPGAPPFTAQQVLGYVEQNYDGLAEGVRAAKQIIGRRELHLPESMASACHYLATREDPAEAAAFFARVRDGVGLEAGDPVLALRRQLARYRGEPHKPRPYVVGALVIKAFNLWRDGANVSALAWRRGGSAPEEFPLIAPAA